MPPATSWLMRPALLRTLVSRVRLAVRLLRDPAVPLFAKALTLLPLLYILSPVDVLPDLIPVLGQLDDLGVLIAAVEAFVGICPTTTVDFHRRAIDEGRAYSPSTPGRWTGGAAGAGPGPDVIDAEFRRE